MTFLLRGKPKENRREQLQMRGAAQRNARHMYYIGAALSEHATKQLMRAVDLTRFAHDY